MIQAQSDIEHVAPQAPARSFGDIPTDTIARTFSDDDGEALKVALLWVFETTRLQVLAERMDALIENRPGDLAFQTRCYEEFSKRCEEAAAIIDAALAAWNPPLWAFAN